MKKYAAFAASVAIGAAALVGCGGEDDFCGQAEDIAANSGADTMQKLADEAPDEIADDFQVIADSLEDPTSADQGAVQEAESNIQAWGDDNCDSN